MIIKKQNQIVKMKFKFIIKTAAPSITYILFTLIMLFTVRNIFAWLTTIKSISPVLGDVEPYLPFIFGVAIIWHVWQFIIAEYINNLKIVPGERNVAGSKINTLQEGGR